MSAVDTVVGTRYFTVATAGHVDHGKTSLLRTLTGIDTDRLKEEKERQMTTDLGFAHLRLPPALAVGFIDVPGHGKFLKNMLAGVGGIDLALLVVAADEGPMPQTRQHLKILRLLGVSRILVAVTKVDTVDQSQLPGVAAAVRDLLKQNCLEETGCVYISSVLATGFDELKQALARSLEDLPPRQASGAAFLAIDRVFSKSGFGTVVTGTLVRGEIATGDQVMIEPGAMQGRIRRLESLGHQVDRAGPGQRVALNLVVKEGRQLARGHVVLGARLSPAKTLVVSLCGWEEVTGGEPVKNLNGRDVRLYHGTSECRGRIGWVEVLDIAGKDHAGQLPAAMAQISLEDAAVAEAGDRYVARFGDDTICGGAVLVRDRPRWLTRHMVVEIGKRLMENDYAGACLSYVKSNPQRMVKVEALDRILRADMREQVVEELLGQGQLAALGDYVLPSAFRQELEQRIIQELERAETQAQATAMEPHVPQEQIRSRLMHAADRAAFQQLVQQLAEAGVLVKEADRLRLPARAVAPADSARARLEKAVITVLGNNLCLEVDEIARQVKASPQQVRAVIAALEKRGEAALVSFDFASSAATIEKCHQVLAQLWQKKKDIAPGDFKEAIGTSRKYGMALLGYFDDKRITRRQANGRVLLKMP